MGLYCLNLVRKNGVGVVSPLEMYQMSGSLNKLRIKYFIPLTRVNIINFITIITFYINSTNTCRYHTIYDYMYKQRKEAL